MSSRVDGLKTVLWWKCRWVKQAVVINASVLGRKWVRQWCNLLKENWRKKKLSLLHLYITANLQVSDRYCPQRSGSGHDASYKLKNELGRCGCHMTGLCPSQQSLSAPLLCPSCRPPQVAEVCSISLPHRLTTAASWFLHKRTTGLIEWTLTPSHLVVKELDLWTRSPGWLQRKCQLLVKFLPFRPQMSDMKETRWVCSLDLGLETIYSAEILDTESASHANLTRLWWQLEPQPGLSAVSPPSSSASTHRAKLLRSGHFSRLEGGWDARRPGWMGEVSALARAATTSETSAPTGRRGF